MRGASSDGRCCRRGSTANGSSSKNAFATGRGLRASRHFFHDALVQSLTETVLPALLRYGDRNSMAFSIESRVPFLTPQLADLAYSLPPSAW